MKHSRLFLLAGAALIAGSCAKEPVASFTADKDEVVTGEVVTFTNTSTDAYNAVWDFGDGEWSTAMNPTHVYYNEGDYEVTLQVSNDNGDETVMATTEIEVTGDSVNNMVEASQEVKDQIIVRIVGTWELDDKTTVNSGGGTTIDSYSQIEGEFMADGTIFMTDNVGNKSVGNYDVINSNYLYLNFVEGPTGIYAIETLTSSRMTLENRFVLDLGGGVTNTTTTSLDFGK